MIRIITDSTADLPIELCDEYRIETIPMYIHLNGMNYQDGREINPEMIFEAVEATGVFPKTSAPSPADFIDFFKQDDPAIYISVSSQLSTTFNNALIAQKELGAISVEIIDSKSISTGYGQVVLQAAKWRNEGMGFADLKYHIRNYVNQTRGVFILDTVDYLFRGGRCSAIEHFLSSKLEIRPLLEICTDGSLDVLKKIRGKRSNAVKSLLNYILDQIKNNQINQLIITHLNCDDEASYLIREINQFESTIQITTARIGCVLAMHSGPKPIGIAYNVR